jgi:predicted MFS family arabinose efflux permease
VSCAPGTESRLRAIYRESFIAGVAGLGPHGLALVLLGFGLASAVRSAAGGPLGRAQYRDP